MNKQLIEKAKSTNQQELMGMVYAYKRGELKDPPEKVKKIAKNISLEDAKEYAETKHKGLPNKVDETPKSMTFGEFVKYNTPRFLGEDNE